MSINIVENEIKNAVKLGKKFVIKFVDIGEGEGKLNDGILQAEKAPTYLQKLDEEAVFLNRTKRILSTNHKRQLDKMELRVELEAGRLNGVPQVLSDSQDPNFSSRNFDAEELRALTGLHTTVMKDSIEGQGFMNTLTSRFAVANGLAAERVLIFGDKSSNNPPSTAYKVIDGICKKMGDDADINNETIDLTAQDSDPLTEFYRFLDMFPDVYKVDGGMACFAPSKFVRSVRRFIVGNHYKFNIDASINQDGIPVVEDVPLIAVPQFSLPTASNPVNGFTRKPIILTHKENIQWLADPDDILVQSAFNLRANVWDIASTMYNDINFAQEDGSALAWLIEGSASTPEVTPGADDPEPVTRNISVSVTDGTDPVENVDVVLEDAEEHQYTGKTGSAGGCTISNVPEGTYSVAASATGYTDYTGTFEVSENNTTLSITLTTQ
ncbi:carboxypeptidase-like regulatory domain-containing protein [uncultured Methanobrevibacter sp.]|uniref:carboxypeptidase-like regulatory domain-containing protein n=1 Tax=uncultured Methanobrevibacter sp. TaxID=253161 RepID=UPI0025D2D155|nr:carboxypeptidase-like regulatory domain-containing protein [uncultured Methanobrevibacter sp.]